MNLLCYESWIGGRELDSFNEYPLVHFPVSSVNVNDFFFSTYRDVYCLECNETLGKKYIASSPDIDNLRGLYSLRVEKLNR